MRIGSGGTSGVAIVNTYVIIWKKEEISWERAESKEKAKQQFVKRLLPGRLFCLLTNDGFQYYRISPEKIRVREWV